jgi:8-oxo-dGTP diphosphatase
MPVRSVPATPAVPPAGPVRRAFSVAIFCRHQGEVLLIHHRRLDAWLPIGGEIEPGETPLEAARRELHEETGLFGTFPAGLGVDGTPDGFIGYEEHAAGSKGLHMNFAFVADVPSRTLAACNEYDAILWVGNAIEVETPRNVRQLVALALAAPSSLLAAG